MSVLKQLLKEFWFPSTGALCWTIYNIVGNTRGEWSVRECVNIFGPTFFFLSWFISQWYRVRKQQRVEDGLLGIEASVKRTLAELDTKTADLVGHITGGDSVCYLAGPPREAAAAAAVAAAGAWGPLAVVHVGRHPLYDVNVRIVDLDALESAGKAATFEDLRRSEIELQAGNLIPGHAAMVHASLTLGPSATRRFNVFYTARNGSFKQVLRMRKLDGMWLVATKVLKGDAVMYENVADTYPRKADGAVDWDGV